jgi:RHS repeat-associated protein
MTTKYQPNDANQYAKIAHGTEVVEPEYDPQGNLLHDATRQYTWDADIHLTSVTTQGSVAGVYDPGAKEPAKEPAATQPKTANREPQTATRYVWGEDLSGTLQGAGGIGGLLSSQSTTAKSEPTTANREQPTKNKEPGTKNFFHNDSNGNIMLLTGSQAQETARYSYDAFGQTLTATGPAAQSNRYRFSTKPVEEESNLLYFGYRWYDPLTGRWPSRDPIEERGGVNLYGMVGNGCVSAVDVLGQVPYREVIKAPGLFCGGCICIVQGDSRPTEPLERPIWFLMHQMAVESFILHCLAGGYELATQSCVTLDQVYVRWGVPN